MGAQTKMSMNRQSVVMAASKTNMDFSVSGGNSGISMAQNHMDKTLGWGARASAKNPRSATTVMMAGGGGDGYTVTLINDGEE
jgi:hypothetical protein